MQRSPLDTIVEVAAPEQLVFRVQLAGPWRRLRAWCLDALVWLLLVGLLTLGTQWLKRAELFGFDQGFGLLGLFALWWGYFFVSEVLTGGRSIGKIALRLRVVQGNGVPISWRSSLLRNLLRAVDLVLAPPFVLPIGPLVMAGDPRFRRLGDLAADTMVIVDGATRMDATRSPSPVDAPWVASLPLALPLDRREREALELFAARSSIGSARREELARMIAPVLAQRLALPTPPSATELLLALRERSRRRRDGEPAR